jgi:hypothetical protein
MMSNGIRNPSGVVTRASAAINTPIREKRRWPDTVHLSDLERSVAKESMRPDVARYAETGSKIAINGGIEPFSKPER